MSGENAVDVFKEQGSSDDEAFEAVYAELRGMARKIRWSNPQNTVNTTALVHEAWLRLHTGKSGSKDRDHYLCMAAVAMRQILVDYARYRGAAKRDRACEAPLFEHGIEDPAEQTADDVLALDQAITALEALDPRAARLVLLRFFAGLPLSEAGDVLDISPRTAARDWARARAFLKTHLKT